MMCALGLARSGDTSAARCVEAVGEREDPQNISEVATWCGMPSFSLWQPAQVDVGFRVMSPGGARGARCVGRVLGDRQSIHLKARSSLPSIFREQMLYRMTREAQA